MGNGSLQPRFLPRGLGEPGPDRSYIQNAEKLEEDTSTVAQ